MTTHCLCRISESYIHEPVDIEILTQLEIHVGILASPFLSISVVAAAPPKCSYGFSHSIYMIISDITYVNPLQTNDAYMRELP